MSTPDAPQPEAHPPVPPIPQPNPYAGVPTAVPTGVPTNPYQPTPPPNPYQPVPPTNPYQAAPPTAPYSGAQPPQPDPYRNPYSTPRPDPYATAPQSPYAPPPGGYGAPPQGPYGAPYGTTPPGWGAKPSAGLAIAALVCRFPAIRAIDINPLLNPMVDGHDFEPKNAKVYLDRRRIEPGLLHAGDPAVRVFTGTTPVSVPGAVADSSNPVGLALDIRAGATVLTDPGNHMLQSTSAARPLLSARVNLLTHTEALDDVAWGTYNPVTITNYR